VASPGETDLGMMLATLSVERRPGVFTYVAIERPTTDLTDVAHAIVVEGTQTTLVLPVESALRADLPFDVELAWLTLSVHSSLEAVGLTAAVSARLAALGIACNVIAGYRHDHLLVPVGRADEAIDALSSR
jgi:uncharacterized protein